MDKSMFRYIGRRVLISLMTLLVILTVLFILVKLLPGTPFNDEKLTEGQKAIIMAKYGLDKPLPVQYITYLKNMLTGDFGISYSLFKELPVSTLVGQAAGISFSLGIAAVILGSILGMILGIIAALNQNKFWDTFATIISVIGVAIPSFVFAMLLMLVFGSELRILPTIFNSDDIITSSILPVIALSMSVIANVARFTRTEMISVLNSDYIELVKAKGLSRNKVIRSHCLRNSLIPVVTVLGPILVNLMTGTMVVEKVFSIPGLGRLLVDSIQANDYNIILACSFLYSAMYIIMMLVIDISYGIIDPRIRLGKEE